MKTTKIFFAILSVVVLTTTFYFVGCNQSTTNEPQNTVNTTPGVISKIGIQTSIDDKALKLLLEREISELLSIRNAITTRVFENKVDVVKLKNAYLASDEKRIAELLKYTPSDVENMNTQLRNIVERMINKAPQLSVLIQEKKVKNCSKCNIEEFFNNFNYHVGKSPRLAKVTNVPAGTDCQWVPYLASLALCTTLGPLLYWPCAYVALCSWCWGTEVDALCGKKGN